MEIVPYAPQQHRDAVIALNARFAEAGYVYQLPTDPPETRSPKPAVWAEDFVAVEGDQVFGGYHLKHQAFFIDGQPVELGYLQLPLSLGLLDRKYANVSTGLIFDVIHRSENLYCLGMGSQQNTIVRILEAAGWKHLVVPFLFSVKSPNAFARNIQLPPDRARLQQAMRLAGAARLAGPALWLQKRLRRSKPSGPRGAYDEAQVVPRLDDVAEPLFDNCRSEYALLADRSRDALDCLYPERKTHFIRLIVLRRSHVIGWAILLDSHMTGHKYFGNMRVGSIADCFACPNHAPDVMAAADDTLTRRGVDLVVSNQMHPAWRDALERAGYQHGPSNFFFYFSPAFAERLGRATDWDRRVHINRGDGDGPIHL